MKTPLFKGANVAIVTPLTENGVNFSKLGELIDFQIENGTNAITICGTTGESATLSHEEHCQVIEYSEEGCRQSSCYCRNWKQRYVLCGRIVAVCSECGS